MATPDDPARAPVPAAAGTQAPGGVPLARDARTIGLVGLAHGTSHFHHLLLPPLFPFFITEFGLSYSELGLLVTLFFVVSGIGQALSGFIVDRVGARPILFGAMACFAASSLAAAAATGYGGLLMAAALAGIGNSPFHPVDFTILNKRVSQPRLGHAFSVHGISGNLGWAAAPVFLVGITSASGSWRIAMISAAVLALAVLAMLVWQRDALDDRRGAWAPARPADPGASAGVDEHPMAFLRLPSVWLCFSFFFWTTAALAGVQSFASPALGTLYGLPVGITAFVITAYMVCGAAGMVLGGFLVARVQRLERTIALAMAGAAVLLGAVATGALPPLVAAGVVALAGVGTGLAGPSRDMLIRQAAPPGATGRVYGAVYSGLDIGFATAAPVFGWMLDHGHPAGVFAGAAAALCLGIVSAGLVGLRVARRPAASRPSAA